MPYLSVRNFLLLVVTFAFSRSFSSFFKNVKFNLLDKWIQVVSVEWYTKVLRYYFMVYTFALIRWLKTTGAGHEYYSRCPKGKRAYFESGLVDSLSVPCGMVGWFLIGFDCILLGVLGYYLAWLHFTRMEFSWLDFTWLDFTYLYYTY